MARQAYIERRNRARDHAPSVVAQIAAIEAQIKTLYFTLQHWDELRGEVPFAPDAAAEFKRGTARRIACLEAAVENLRRLLAGARHRMPGHPKGVFVMEIAGAA